LFSFSSLSQLFFILLFASLGSAAACFTGKEARFEIRDTRQSGLQMRGAAAGLQQKIFPPDDQKPKKKLHYDKSNQSDWTRSFKPRSHKPHPHFNKFQKIQTAAIKPLGLAKD
jgi:hypothetical protein